LLAIRRNTAARTDEQCILISLSDQTPQIWVAAAILQKLSLHLLRLNKNDVFTLADRHAGFLLRMVLLSFGMFVLGGCLFNLAISPTQLPWLSALRGRTG
jgi:hypothetical protein